MLITKLLGHFQLRQPTSAPYAVVAHLQGQGAYLGRLNVLLARAGDLPCQTRMQTHEHSYVGGGLATCLSAADTLALAARFPDPEDMLARLAALADTPCVPRLQSTCCCGSCHYPGSYRYSALESASGPEDDEYPSDWDDW